MKILSCHIENFGKLQGIDLSFDKGLNVICEDNGWGKSTLAAFIKAMFYGLDKKKKDMIAEDERKKYTPWQTGVFGGSLVFETNGRQYTVTRLFGDKPAKDSFELRDSTTNLPSTDFSEHLGEELFKIDSASFYRSIFIGQNDCRTSVTDDIHAKIGNLADNTGDINNYESAADLLKKQINRLTPDRKTGTLSKRADKITELQRSINDGSSLQNDLSETDNALSEIRNQYKAAVTEQEKWEEIQKKVIAAQKNIRLRDEWERLRSARNEVQKQLDDVRAGFPGNIPPEESVIQMRKHAENMRSAENLRDSYKLTQEEIREAVELKKVFASRIPTESEIDKAIADEQRIRNIRQHYERLRLSEPERDRMNELSEMFADDKCKPAEMTALWNERISKKNALVPNYASLSVLKENANAQRQSKIRQSLVLTAAGAVLLLAGVFTCFTASLIPSLIAAAVGAVILAAGVATLSIRIKSPLEEYFTDEFHTLARQIAEDTEWIRQTDAAVTSYLSAHGMTFNESDVSGKLQEITLEYYDFQRLREKHERAEAYAKENDWASSERTAQDFFSEFHISCQGEPTDILYKLKSAVNRFRFLSDKRKQHNNADSVCQKERNSVKQFLDTYAFDSEGDMRATLERISDGVKRYADLSKRLEEASSELRQFESVNDTDALASDSGTEHLPEPEEAAEALKRCHEAILALEKQEETLTRKRDDLNEQTEQWERDKASLERLRETQENERVKYERLVKTDELLRRAKEAMTARYVTPIKKSFGKYYQLLASHPADRVLIDANINVTVDEQGKQRELKTLSAGYRDITGFCLRLALADAMFREEKPPLIMDDPFTNLDDGKVAASKQMLETVAEDYQIIYFTCSRSRQ